MSKSFSQLKSELNQINRSIENLTYVDADRADIDELIHERTKIQWAIVSRIDQGN